MPYATNDGIRIYYEVEGDGPPLVLHTGFMGRLQNWRREDTAIAQALRGEYRLILLDPRGQGQSDKPHHPGAYAMETRVRDVTAVLDAEGVDRAHFWGYSMGALYGYGVGIYAPERCRSLILGGFSPYSGDPTALRRQAAALRQGTIEDYVAGLEAQEGAPFPPAVREGFLANDPLALAAFREARATDPDLGEQLATITVPTLVYAGEADPSFAGACRSAEAIPGATFVALPGLNHSLAFRARDAILPHVRAFLALVP